MLHDQTRHTGTVPLDSERPGAALAWLIFSGAGPRYGQALQLRGIATTIGRAPGCDIVVEDHAVSRQHARISIEGGDRSIRYILRDLASSNGTFVNARRALAVELAGGDVIRIGHTELTFKHFT
jgi:pSer/pThr/pTyr-binding forkhead associated (FHA) protein